MPTVKDVAKIAGVSTATVSRALSNPDKVQEATRIKVMNAASELGYSPNAMARSLRRQESKTILVILPDIANPFFSEIIHGIEDVAHREKYKILLGDAGHNVTRANSYMELYESKQVDGVILLTAEIAEETLERHSRSKDLPAVMACEYFEDSFLPVVHINNEDAAKHAVDYLISLGHTRIGSLTGPLTNPICRDRHNGFQQALENQNLEFKNDWVHEGDFTFQAGVNLGRTLLNSKQCPTAVFCHNDEMAIGLLNIAKEKGLSLPEDLSVIGFDNIQFSEYCEPSLTTVHQPRQQIGENAMRMLLDRLQNKKTVMDQTLPTQLIVRRSAARPKGQP